MKAETPAPLESNKTEQYARDRELVRLHIAYLLGKIAAHYERLKPL